ncbi:hypothetical protein QQP08_009260 [Theobroma cacao]|nr:hypothetical protein QQP08_009260 [Theobroma cacao]
MASHVGQDSTEALVSINSMLLLRSWLVLNIADGGPRIHYYLHQGSLHLSMCPEFSCKAK